MNYRAMVWGVINWILGGVPNELICFADSDVLFRPGWFEHSLAILDAYPKAGLISAQPCLDDVLHGSLLCPSLCFGKG